MSPEHSTAVAAGAPARAPAATAPAATAGPTSNVHEDNNTVPTCANCGAAVPGKFCGSCGQRLEHGMHSVVHFVREATEDLTHADSRLWHTLGALLFKPGLLTREFIAGRRVRYLPPIRLYLVLSVLFFLVMGLASEGSRAVQIKTGSGSTSVPLVRPESVEGLAAKPGETPLQRKQRLCNPDYSGPLSRFVEPFMRKGCLNFLENRGRSMGEAFWHNLPKALFVFLPALALVMKVMYWRPRHYYVEHLLFFLHNHAFGFLVFGLLGLIALLAPSSIGNLLQLAVWLYVPYYVFVAMRRVYGQGPWLTFAKFVVLSFAYFFGAAVTSMITAMYSVYSA